MYFWRILPQFYEEVSYRTLLMAPSVATNFQIQEPLQSVIMQKSFCKKLFLIVSVLC